MQKSDRISPSASFHLQENTALVLSGLIAVIKRVVEVNDLMRCHREKFVSCAKVNEINLVSCVMTIGGVRVTKPTHISRQQCNL